MSEAKPIASPLVAGCKVTKSETEPLTDATQFRSIIGALQYVTITRPELSFSVNKVCQFMSQPREPHWTAVKRILRYLKVTLTWGLKLLPASSNSVLSLQAYCDADWAADPDGRRSTSGACVFLGPNLISCWSKKQPVVAQSSTGA